MEVNINRANNTRRNSAAFMILWVLCPNLTILELVYDVVVNIKDVTFGYLIS